MRNAMDRMDAIVGVGKYRTRDDAVRAAEYVRGLLPLSDQWEAEFEYDREDRDWEWKLTLGGLELSAVDGKFCAAFRIVMQSTTAPKPFAWREWRYASHPIDAVRKAVHGMESAMQSAVDAVARAKAMLE